jgi:hypothetical protein
MKAECLYVGKCPTSSRPWDLIPRRAIGV